MALADAIGMEINAGTLSPGDRLPTHRDLARLLGVTVGTVSRGYAEAQRRGLTTGEVGRGTFVRGKRGFSLFGESTSQNLTERGSATVDMGLTLPWIPPDGSDGKALQQTLAHLAMADGLDELLRFDQGALPRHRDLAASWLSERGHAVGPERTLTTCGNQHALFVVLSTLLAAGDTLLTASVTYPGLSAVAHTLGIRIRGVALDQEGMDPTALGRLADETGAKAVYVLPTIQNPTTRTMSEERRLALAEVAWEKGLTILEDDVYALSAPGYTPLARLAPERTVYMTTFSKTLSFGFRIGFMTGPREMTRRLESGIQSTLWMPPALQTEVLLRWLHDGTAERVCAKKQQEMAARQAVVKTAFPHAECDPRGNHAWLPLADPWTPRLAVEGAQQLGMIVVGSDAFAAGRDYPHAIRIALGNVPTREAFSEAIDRLSTLLAGRPRGRRALI